MKGQAKVVDVLIALGLVVCFLILIMQIPKFYKDVFDMFALTSAEVVSNDIATLISISNAAPYKIILTYEINQKEVSYSVELKNRYANVTHFISGKPTKSAYAGYAVNLDKKVENEKCFVITKYPDHFDFGVCP